MAGRAVQPRCVVGLPGWGKGVEGGVQWGRGPSLAPSPHCGVGAAGEPADARPSRPGLAWAHGNNRPLRSALVRGPAGAAAPLKRGRAWACGMRLRPGAAVRHAGIQQGGRGPGARGPRGLEGRRRLSQFESLPPEDASGGPARRARQASAPALCGGRRKGAGVGVGRRRGRGARGGLGGARRDSSGEVGGPRPPAASGCHPPGATASARARAPARSGRQNAPRPAPDAALGRMGGFQRVWGAGGRTGPPPRSLARAPTPTPAWRPGAPARGPPRPAARAGAARCHRAWSCALARWGRAGPPSAGLGVRYLRVTARLPPRAARDLAHPPPPIGSLQLLSAALCAPRLCRKPPALCCSSRFPCGPEPPPARSPRSLRCARARPVRAFRPP
jgi:hypothetical protein